MKRLNNNKHTLSTCHIYISGSHLPAVSDPPPPAALATTTK